MSRCTLGRAPDGRPGANSNAVRVQLQADCYAGVWAHNAARTPDESGRPVLTRLTDADIRDGQDAAATVGDDRIQEKLQGRVTPEPTAEVAEPQAVPTRPVKKTARPMPATSDEYQPIHPGTRMGVRLRTRAERGARPARSSCRGGASPPPRTAAVTLCA